MPSCPGGRIAASSSRRSAREADAAAPAVPPDWQVNGILTGLGLTAMLLGTTAFSHRDLQGE